MRRIEDTFYIPSKIEKDSLTVREFINLTKNAYGGENVKELEKNLWTE